MIVLHHLEHSRSQRIAWLLEEIEAPYEIKRYARDRRTMLAPPELRAVHPLGKAPIVVDDGTVLIESGAIIEYLLGRHGQAAGLVPATGTPEHLAYLTFLHFAEGSFMPPLVLRLIFSTMAAKSPALLRPLVRAVTAPVESFYVRPNLTGILDFLEHRLGEAAWFAGERFSGADVQMSFPIEMAQQRGGLDGDRPKLMDFLARIHARPAYARARQRIGEV
jgi:glutathione S-transferase